MRLRTSVFGLVLLGLSAAAAAQDRRPSFVEQLRSIAVAYRDYGRVDDELRWAPYLCRMPIPSRARISRAEAAHGQKVYFVYASDRDVYVRTTGGAREPLPVGFTVVKESFAPVPVEEWAPSEPHPYWALRTETGFVGAGAPTGLFVMRYLGERAPNTDAGWIYGTLDATGAVTAAGRLESCIGCHARAPHGRLFGLARE